MPTLPKSPDGCAACPSSNSEMTNEPTIQRYKFLHTLFFYAVFTYLVVNDGLGAHLPELLAAVVMIRVVAAVTVAPK